MQKKGKRERGRTTKEWMTLLARVFLVGYSVACVLLLILAVVLMHYDENVAQPMPEHTEVEVEVVPSIAQLDAMLDALEEPDEPSVSMKLWATCRVTAYCPCEKCCGEYAKHRPIDPITGQPIVYGASGVQLESLKHCASSLPFGTKIYIPALELHLVVEDRAAKWIDSRYSSKYVDIYIDDHAQCFSYLSGKDEYMEVYIEE